MMCRRASVSGSVFLSAALLLFALLSTASAVAGEVAELPCDPPCGVNGECVPYLGNLTCNCIGNWSGDDCSVSICEADNPCLNEGTCSHDPADPSRFLCSCKLPYFGDICQFTNKMNSGNNSCEIGNPCNGSSCYNLADGSGHQCFCREGKWGIGCNYDVCDWRNDSVMCSAPYDRCMGNTDFCNGHGTCIWDDSFDGTYRSRCDCDPGWEGFKQCSTTNGARMQCKNRPCGDNGQCEYVLPQEYNPESEEVVFEGYMCICDGEHQGKNCSDQFDVCSLNPCVSGTCNATHEGHYFKCICPPDRMGRLCENFIDPCSSLVCENGGNCTTRVPPNSDGSYSSPHVWCSCCTGFTGDRCQISSDNHTLCRPNPCHNGKECTLLSDTSYRCECGDDFTGVNCELPNLCSADRTSCHSQNTDYCIVDNRSGGAREICVCKKDSGWGGATCSEDIDECLGNSAPLCHNGGTCVNKPGGNSCSCTPEYTGPECKDYVPQPVNCSSTNEMCENGGLCVDQPSGEMVCNCTSGFTGDFCQIVACQHNYCEDRGRNGECDLECFNEECGYDGREGLCLPNNTRDPWENCSNPTHCRQKANNSRCDPECNTRDCLYDFHECVPSPEVCPANQSEFCQNHTNDGKCDETCNTPECPFDSKDCNSRRFLRDRLVVYILGSDLAQNKEAQRRFAAAVGAITNTNPVIESVELLGAEEGAKEGIDVPEGQNLYRVTLRLDTEYCSDWCINSVEEAVKFLNAYYASGNKDIAGFSYVKSDTEPDEGPTEGPGGTNTTVTAIVITIILVAFLGLFVVGGVIVGKKRKIIRAKIFYPGQSQVDDSAHERSPPNKKRKVAQTDLASGTLVSSTEESSMTASCTSGDYIRAGSKAAKMEGSSKITWADYKVPVGDSPGHDPSDVAVVSQIGKDSRKWNYLHYSAVRNPEIMRGLLEKCRGDESKKWDINTPGPGGYTPLMLAVTQKSPDCFPLPSRSSSSSDSSGEHSEHNGLLLSPMTRAIQMVPHSDTSSPSGSFPGSPFNCSVDALLSARVKLDATNDYGRTALHLAAVCARGDYVRRLLAAGANPNVQDNWGQSVLHAAIGAAAEGAFQMLLDFPKTDINLKSDGGITPLMDAVKSTNMYMVKQLVKKNADISLTDYEGRTAVHWAAMTENVEALKLLIRQGPDTIKDTQDNKGQTALFLACREGATECTRHLLDVFANATLLDNLDRSPMTIAFERQHLYIIEMLKSHGPYHYQLPASGRHGPTVPHHIQMVQAHHHHEMALRQQQMPPQQQAYPAAYPHPPTSHHPMMVEMQPMPPALEHYSGPEMQLPPRGQTFGDVGYPVSSMDLGLPGSASFKPMSLFYSNHGTENGGVHTPTAAVPQHFYPPSTSSQLPVTSAEHSSPPTTYHQHSSPPNVQLTTASDLPAAISTSYSQPHPVSCGVPQPDPTTSYPTYPASTGHYPVTSTTSDSEQRMVSELITSISESSPPQPPQLPSPPQQQPHSASSVHSNRSPSSLYPSPPNSDTLQHSSEVAHQNGLMTGAYPHASPPSLTPSPEGRDETQNITTIEGLVQQHDYPYGDSYNYGGIRFTQDYSTETTV